MADIRECSYVYIIGANDIETGELVLSEKHFVPLEYVFTVALSVLDRCDHVIVTEDDDMVITGMKLSDFPKDTLIINKME